MPKPIPKCVSMNMYTDEKTYLWRSYYIIYDKHKYIYIYYIYIYTLHLSIWHIDKIQWIYDFHRCHLLPKGTRPELPERRRAAWRKGDQVDRYPKDTLDWYIYHCLPTWMVDFDGKLVGKYTVRPMDPTGHIILLCFVMRQPELT